MKVFGVDLKNFSMSSIEKTLGVSTSSGFRSVGFCGLPSLSTAGSAKDAAFSTFAA